jgi:hypothetical protein
LLVLGSELRHGVFGRNERIDGCFEEREWIWSFGKRLI